MRCLLVNLFEIVKPILCLGGLPNSYYIVVRWVSRIRFCKSIFKDYYSLLQKS